jgi:serine/threonine protein phosphatase 1
MRWVVGDIHGMLRPLRALVDAVARRDPAARLLFVGDYVNRGPDSRGVVDLLLDLPGAGFVRGNHDDVFDLVLNGCNYDPSATPDPLGAFVWFMNHGLASTFSSYGVDAETLEDAILRPSPAKLAAVTAAVPERHKQFFRSLPAVIEEDDAFVAHAMWHPDEPDDRPDISQRLAVVPRLRHHVLWGRYREADVSGRKRWARTGYFGHTPVQTFGHRVNGGRNVPLRGPGIVLLDTAAALTSNGRLSAVCVETGELVQTDRLGGIVTERE